MQTVNLPPYLDPRSSLSTARSVYFEFDDTTMKPEFANLVETHGKYLASNPTLKVRVEGNTDERGSAEYNLALGQKRAEAVFRARPGPAVMTSRPGRRIAGPTCITPRREPRRAVSNA